MNWIRWAFQGPFGLRSGWRVAIWLGLAAVLQLLVAVIAIRGLGMSVPDSTDEVLAFNGMALAPAALLGTWILTRFLDRQPLGTVGLAGPAGAAAAAVTIGIGLGIACVSAGVAVLTAGGFVDLDLESPGRATLVFALLRVTLLLLLAAAYEEIFFRGYCFQWLARALGFWPVAIGSSFLFGVAHLGNDSVTLVAFLVIVLSGVLLAYSLRISGGLWMPIGLHFGWNAAQGVLFGLPISGMPGLPSIASSRLEGADLWTGGGFGLEGSIVAFVSLAVGFAGLAARRKTRDTMDV